MLLAGGRRPMFLLKRLSAFSDLQAGPFPFRSPLRCGLSETRSGSSWPLRSVAEPPARRTPTGHRLA